MYTVDTLTSIGGKEWSNANGLHRVYFNNLRSLYGLECTYYKTGNISSATLNGEKISNSVARRLACDLDDMKIYYDIEKGEFGYKGDSGKAEELIVKIKALLEPEAVETTTQAGETR